MRLIPPDRASLDEDSQRIWDGIAGPRGGLFAPFQILMRRPALAERVAALAKHFRWSGSLNEAERELAIVATARACRNGYAATTHESRAIAAGVDPRALEATLSGGPLDSPAARDALVIEIARALASTYRLDDALYARARDEFGEETLVELVALSGLYQMIASVLGAFGVDSAESAATIP